MVGKVFRGVPAPDGQVHAAHEGNGVVDADDFLMMGAIKRMLAVEPDLCARMVLPRGAEQKRQRRAGRVQVRHAPNQDADFQQRPLFDQERSRSPSFG